MAKAIWERRNPRRRHAKLTPSERRRARRAAKKNGRGQPSLVDNINARRKKRSKA